LNWLLHLGEVEQRGGKERRRRQYGEVSSPRRGTGRNKRGWGSLVR